MSIEQEQHGEIEQTADREFALKIISQIEKNLGIPIRHIFERDSNAQTIRAEMRKVVAEYLRKLPNDVSDRKEWEDIVQNSEIKSMLGDAFNVVPSVSYLESNVKILAKYRGDELHEFVKRTSNSLSLIHDGSSAGEIAGTIIGTGIASIGAVWIYGTWKAMRAGNALRAAVVLGIRALKSTNIAVGIITILLTELLLYLMLKNSKVFLAMVFNNTDSDLVVNDWRKGVNGGYEGDLLVNSGDMVAFPQSHVNEHLDSPVAQMPKRLTIAPNDPDNLVMSGFFSAEKGVGFKGTDGVAVYSDRLNSKIRFAFLFACPYSADNGINVAIGGEEIRSAKSYYDELIGSRSLYAAKSSSNYSIEAVCNSARGGEAAAIAIISQVK